MKIILAPDSFKGSLSSEEISSILKDEALKVFPEASVYALPMADGGEGTITAVTEFLNGSYRDISVKGPLFEPVQAKMGIIGDGTAIIEMASASGLPLVPEGSRNPLYTTTYGTGELIRSALDEGCRKIMIGIGGSATNDGGIGAMAALGVRFLDSDGNSLKPIGKNLKNIADIDVSGLHPAISDTEFTVMCDVDNPLCGERGATYVFGPQKGGDEAVLTELENGMLNYAGLLNEKFGFDSKSPGSGAAGGLGAALQVFLSAKLRPGITTLLNLYGFENMLNGCDLVITGEGRVDYQSAYGKVLSGIGGACKSHGVPVIAVTGGIGKGAETLYEHGISAIVPIANGAITLDYAISNAKSLIRETGHRIFSLIKIGTYIK
jgi:glycerate kinase